MLRWAPAVAALIVAAVPLGAWATTGAVTVYPYPSSLYYRMAAWQLAPGPDGALWFTEDDNKQVSPYYWHLGRFTPSGVYSDFKVAEPFNKEGPIAITKGPDGNLWFTRIGSVGKISKTYALTEYPIANATLPESIIAGRQSDLWFVESQIGPAASIGRITTAGALTEYPVPQGISSNLVLGADGNIWFCSGVNIARLVPNGQVQIGAAACAPGVAKLASSGDGKLWSGPEFTKGARRIYRIGLDFSETVFPFTGFEVETISSALDGNVWVLSITSGRTALIRVAHDGSQTQYDVPGIAIGSPPNFGGLTVGPDGSLWYSVPDAWMIGRFELDTLALSPVQVLGVHGVVSTMTVAKIFDTDLNKDPTQYVGIIRWGDGQSSLGVAVGADPFALIGRHSYAVPGTYQILAGVRDRDGLVRFVATNALIT